MSSKIKVDYDAAKGRFLVFCPFHLNSLPKSLPNRKWDPKAKHWSAPAIKANVEYINSKFGPSTTEFTEPARQAVESSLKKYRDAAAGIRSTDPRFPTWYPFKTQPRQKQREALDKIFGLEAVALFMDMRTGKTKVVIDLASALRMQAMTDRVLIVCPLSIRKNWVRELSDHAPFPVDVHLLDTSKPKKYDQWMAAPHDFKWLIVGVESLAAGSAIKFCERFLMSSIKPMMAVDESSKIKTHNATRSQNVVSLGRMAKYRVAMTGTPIANGPIDLFMQFEFLDPDIIGLGDFYSFRNQYAVMGGFEDKNGRPTQIIGYQNLEELMEVIEPFIFQVRKHEVFPDAPSKIYIRREVQMNPAQKELYRQMKKEAKIMTGDKSLIVQNTLEKMLRLQEITSGIITYAIPENKREKNGPKFYREYIPGNNPKVDELMDVLEEYDGPAIIWCAYVEEIKLVVSAMRAKFGDDQVVELHGAISEEDRDINVNVKFQGGTSKYLVANAATGSMGLTMSTAEIEVYVSNTFNYIDREQSEERAFGPHKKNGTVVVDILAAGTVDYHIADALEQKKDVSEYVRGSIDDLKERLLGEGD
jgi:SNF2 family DNA or RNA helicase